MLGGGSREIPQRDGAVRRRRLVEARLDRGQDLGRGVRLHRKDDMLAAEMIGQAARGGGLVAR